MKQQSARVLGHEQNQVIQANYVPQLVQHNDARATNTLLPGPREK